jgi:hypothetical protein
MFYVLAYVCLRDVIYVVITSTFDVSYAAAVVDYLMRDYQRFGETYYLHLLGRNLT